MLLENENAFKFEVFIVWKYKKKNFATIIIKYWK